MRALLAALLTAVLLAGCSSQPSFHGAAITAPAPDFDLVTHRGDRARLSDERGQVVLLLFGVGDCTTACPAALRTLDAALDRVPGADEVRVLLVTVDPERDTPVRLARFVAPFRVPVLGLTGAPSAVARVRAAYAAYAPLPGAGPDHAGHTAQVYGIDRQGRLRVVTPTADPAALAEDVRALLALR